MWKSKKGRRRNEQNAVLSSRRIESAPERHGNASPKKEKIFESKAYFAYASLCKKGSLFNIWQKQNWINFSKDGCYNFLNFFVRCHAHRLLQSWRSWIFGQFFLLFLRSLGMAGSILMRRIWNWGSHLPELPSGTQCPFLLSQTPAPKVEGGRGGEKQKTGWWSREGARERRPRWQQVVLEFAFQSNEAERMILGWSSRDLLSGEKAKHSFNFQMRKN